MLLFSLWTTWKITWNNFVADRCRWWRNGRTTCMSFIYLIGISGMAYIKLCTFFNSNWKILLSADVPSIILCDPQLTFFHNIARGLTFSSSSVQFCARYSEYLCTSWAPIAALLCSYYGPMRLSGVV